MPENEKRGPDNPGSDDLDIGPTQRNLSGEQTLRAAHAKRVEDLDIGPTQRNLSGEQTLRPALAKRAEDLDSSPTLRRKGTDAAHGLQGELAEKERQVGRRASDKVFDRYVLQRVLGRGGMGIVWLALDLELEREVALKFLPDALAYNAGALKDLKRETRRALDLTHRNIVRVHDWVSDGEHAAVCMEYVDGHSLGCLRADKESGVFEAAEIREWVRQLCEALEYAHARVGVVHRDLKPANLLVNANGELKVTDFGIARSLGETMTRTTGGGGGVSGSPGYMSPQQWQGKRGQVSDDIYSLGATIYELLTGKPPFYSGDIRVQTLEEAPPSMAERRRELEVESDEPIPEEWEAIVAACLAKEAAARPASAKVVWEVISRPADFRSTETTQLQGRDDIPERPRAGNGASTETGRAEPPAATVQNSLQAAANAVVLENSRGAGRVSQTGKPIKNGLGMELVWIAPGKFMMGSPAGEEGRESDEGPQTEVTLSKGFWLGKYEVTQGEYETVMGSNPSYFEGALLPVETVSWNDAMEFCRRLTERERNTRKLPAGYEYRLPTEAQWEFACRAGSTTRFTFGDADSQLEGAGWYGSNGANQTHPVGQKQPNAWGLCDMHGNVWEWCYDWLGDYPGGSVTDPTGAISGSFRVNRGGSWEDRAGLCRSADRDRYDPSNRYFGLGFRAALVAMPPTNEVTRVEHTSRTEEERTVAVPWPGQPIKNGLGMELIWIAPGKFMMGSPAGEAGRHDKEGPQTEVTLTKGFWLGKYEVMQAEYEAVMGINPSHFKGAVSLPVETVSWTEAVEFCQKLTERERNVGKLPVGYEYRLPTEAQWEYACRAGTTTPFSFGDSESQLRHYAWYWDNSGKKTWPVALKQPNAWGLYDMHGNAWEWCSDWFGNYPGGSVVDPTGVSLGSAHVIRGGGWYDTAGYCRSACRGFRFNPRVREEFLGFRTALVSVQ